MTKSPSHQYPRSGDLDSSGFSLDFEIPPAIACAICGLTNCEGCEQPEPARSQAHAGTIAWEQTEHSRARRLWDTTRATALNAESTFRDLAREAYEANTDGTRNHQTVLAAFNYAFIAEFWAVSSWTLPWSLGFAALFPRLAWHMISSPVVLVLGFVILLFLVLCVVAIHMWWGFTVEWGISRAGQRASYRTGLRFGLYACGWDLLTSPAGLLVHLMRDGWPRGLASVRSGTQAPRTAMNAYLVLGRGLSEPERRTAMWTAVGVTSASLLMGFGGILIGLIWWLVRDL